MILLKILERVPKGYIIRDQFSIAEDEAPEFVEVPTQWTADNKELRKYRHILHTDEAHYYVPTDLKPDGNIAHA